MPAVDNRGSRGPYAKTAEVRHKAVTAAAQAFAETGFHGTTMAAIARRAEISHTGLLHHFPTKEDLLVTVLAQHDQRAGDYLEAHNALDPDANPLAMLAGMLAVSVDDSTSELSRAAAVLTAEATAPTHPAHAHFTARYTHARSFYTRVYGALARRGALRTPLPAETLADITTAFLDGLRTRHLFSPDDTDVAATVHDFVHSLILTPETGQDPTPH